MPRSGPRPHCWKVQGAEPHSQHTAWLRAKAQAAFRAETWCLTFDEFQQIWQGRWSQRGRARDDYVMMRQDVQGAWCVSNVACVPRIEYLSRQREYRGR